MVSYVNDILAGIRSSIKDLELRITLLEAGGFTPGASTGGMVNSAMLTDLLDRIEALESRVSDLESVELVLGLGQPTFQVWTMIPGPGGSTEL